MGKKGPDINSITQRVCKTCGVNKLIQEFPFNEGKKPCWLRQCKQCYTDRRVKPSQERKDELNRKRREERLKNPEKWRATHLRSKRRIQPEEYDALLKEQDGKCAICKKDPKENERHLCVDHCHETTGIRELLCLKCNSMLGMANDDINIFYTAIAYLEKWQVIHGPPPNDDIERYKCDGGVIEEPEPFPGR